MNIRLITILSLSIIGGIIKIVGGVYYGSKALLVDAFTSFGNILAAILVIYYYNRSLAPPDKDHMFGHHRLTIAGPIYTVVIYSAIFGIASMELINTAGKPYIVSEYAPIMAGIGFIVYLIAIGLSRKMDIALKIYATFTGSELIESIVTILASLSGAYLSYIIDFLGAIILATFIVYEVYFSISNIVGIVSDETSREIIGDIKRELKLLNINIGRIRVRRIIENIYHGDITIMVPPDTSISDAHELADYIEDRLRKKYNIDLTIHIEPEERGFSH